MSPKKRGRVPSQARPAGTLLLESGEAAGRLHFPLAVLALATFAGILSFCQIRSLDIGWHIQTGRWIVENGRVPVTDPFSYTAAGQPWVSHEWLFGLLSWAVFRLGGLAALSWAKSLLVALLFALAAWAARLRGARPGMILLVLAAAHPVAYSRFIERPELVSLPLAVCFLLLSELGRRRPWLWTGIPLLELAWANMHGGTAILGWGLAAVPALDRAWELWRSGCRGADFRRDPGLRRGLAAAAGAILLSLANPHGLRALFYGRLRAESPLDNQEFYSMGWMLRERFDLSMALFLAFALVLAVQMVRNRRETRASDWLLAAALLALNVVYFRFRPLFVFLLAPALASYLSKGRIFGRLRWWAPAALAAGIAWHFVSFERSAYLNRFGTGLHPGILPMKCVEFLRDTGMKGRMFNSYGLGGLLIWHLWPDQKVFIDGREDVYNGPGVLEAYLHAFDSPGRWQGLASKWAFDYAVIRYPDQAPATPDRSLDALAFPRRDWALVYFDDAAAVYVRRIAAFETIIREHEYRWVQPFQLSGYLDPVLRDPASFQALMGEIERSRSANPDSFRIRFLLGMVAAKRGPDFTGDAVREFEESARLNPDFVPAYINLAAACVAAGRIAEGRRALERVLALEDNPQARESLRRLPR